MPECRIKENLKYCTCSFTTCAKRGLCCECIEAHRGKGELPGCYFPPDVEKTGERSVEKFAELIKERGRWW